MMDPHFLLKDELEYELACRGIELKTTAPVMKKVLHELIVSEQSGGAVQEVRAPASTNLLFEFEICSAKINTLSNYISEINGKPDKSVFRRLVSRLYHVQNRILLVQPESEDDSIRKDGLMQQCQILLNKLEGQDDIVEEENLSPEDKEILESTLGDLGRKIIEKFEISRASTSASTEDDSSKRVVVDQKLKDVIDRLDKSVSFATSNWNRETDYTSRSRGRLGRTSTVEEDFPIRKLVPIYQWGLKYSGGKDMSVNSFLERVSELKEARNATDLDLWRYAIDLFEGEALIWYRANKEYADSWDELVILLRRAFQRPYYQEELLTEIKARTQGCDESVLIYISVMQNLFNRLPNKISETDKILIILKNLQPYFQQAVCRDSFSCIPELVNVLRIVERTKINCNNFQQPRICRDMLEPDLGYKSEIVLEKRNNSARDIDEVAEVTTVASNKEETVRRQVIQKRCWNCRESGHTFRLCTVPKQRLFCFKCGKFGVTSDECGCKGNAQGRNTSSAN